MDADKARRIVAEIVAFRQRWGNLGGTGPDSLGAYTLDDLVEALAFLVEEGDITVQGHSEGLTKVKRQLTAALAREAKQKKQIEELKEALAEVTQAWEDQRAM